MFHRDSLSSGGVRPLQEVGPPCGTPGQVLGGKDPNVRNGFVFIVYLY